MSKSFTIVV